MANLLLSTLWSIAASTTSNRPESLSAPSPTPWTGLHCGVTSLSPLQPPSCPTAARVSLRRWDHGPPWRRQGGPPGCRSLWPVCRRWWERREAVERRCDPGSGPPAILFGVTLTAARRRRRPVALETSTLAATLFSAVRTAWQPWGDPVSRPPAVQFGVTLLAARLKCCAAAVLFSPAPCLWH